jgi:hypothetical protein
MDAVTDPFTGQVWDTDDLRPVANTDPPKVRCSQCGGRCKPHFDGPRWISCHRCYWSSHDPRRRGLLWWLRVWLGC